MQQYPFHSSYEEGSQAESSGHDTPTLDSDGFSWRDSDEIDESRIDEFDEATFGTMEDRTLDHHADVRIRLIAPCMCFGEIIRRKVQHHHASHAVVVEVIKSERDDGVSYPDEMAESIEIIGEIDDYTERWLRRDFDEPFFSKAIIGHDVMVVCDGDNAGDAECGAEWIGYVGTITDWDGGMYGINFADYESADALCGFQVRIVGCPYFKRLGAFEREMIAKAMADPAPTSKSTNGSAS